MVAFYYKNYNVYTYFLLRFTPIIPPIIPVNIPTANRINELALKEKPTKHILDAKYNSKI